MALDTTACLATAWFCGFVVGWNRERYAKPAGIRTHILVCLGAAVFVHLGVIAHRLGDMGTLSDFNRLVQSVATGIGFLGAGAIFRAGSHVHGVTTAASIWVVGAAGAAAGAGALPLALGVTTVTFFVLRWSGSAPILDELAKPPPPEVFERKYVGASEDKDEDEGASGASSSSS
jgi:putative Mg2+ transporter-C (MgtC) family protein